MSGDVSRRVFFGKFGTVAAAGLVAGQVGLAEEGSAAGPGRSRIVGISCSPRPGKTTAEALEICLEAAAQGHEGLQTELIELAGLDIPVFDPASPGSEDFNRLVEELAAENVVGIIIGTPVYFSGMSSLCKAFLDQCMVFRQRSFALRNKVAGVLAVGGVRNGGQELAIQSVQAALMCQEMILVGDGRPTAHIGATLLNTNDSVSGDSFGLSTARNLGARVAEVALALAGRGAAGRQS